MTKQLYEMLKQEHNMSEETAQAAFDFVLHALEENKDLLWEEGNVKASNFAKGGALGLCAMMVQIDALKNTKE